VTPRPWHDREPFPACGCRTSRGLLCVRPARWTVAKDEEVRRVCTAHAALLQQDGWVHVPQPIAWAL